MRRLLARAILTVLAGGLHLGWSMAVQAAPEAETVPPPAEVAKPAPTSTVAELAEASARAIASVRLQQQRLQALIAELQQWDQGGKEAENGGAGMALRRAERFLAERQARRNLAARVLALTAEVEAALAACQAESEALRAALEDARRQPSADGRAMAGNLNETPALPRDPGSITYYQMKEPLTLRELAGRTEIYGDPGMWRVLLNSNPGVAATGDSPLPIGTLLIVPNLKVMRDFQIR